MCGIFNNETTHFYMLKSCNIINKLYGYLFKMAYILLLENRCSININFLMFLMLREKKYKKKNNELLLEPKIFLGMIVHV